MDETDLLLFPPLRAGWGYRGFPIRVPISGWNEKRVIFGAINILSGYRLFQVHDRHREADFKSFLHLIRSSYRGWQIRLVLDEHPSHKAKGSRQLARDLGVKLLWLPKRSPRLNPMDTLWGHVKDHLSANKQYEDIEDATDVFVEHLQQLTHREALQAVGALKSDFWLYW
jgi:transposase